LAVALGANARFVARSVDVFASHLKEVLTAAAAHRGSALVEIYQNCNIFNDDAFASFTERGVRDDRMVVLEEGKPVLFGAKKDRGLRIRGFTPEVVEFE